MKLRHANARTSRLSTLLWIAGLVAFVMSTFYPSDLSSYAGRKGVSIAPETAYDVDHYGRFVNTALQIGLPILLRDREGIIEVLKIALAATLSTHLLKHLLNHVYVMDTRLGQRPSSPGSNFNMPSGHGSMSSCAAYFVSRRYGWKLLFIVLPIMLLTLFARVSLDKHTVSAVISGALLGIAVSACFTTRYRRRVAGV